MGRVQAGASGRQAAAGAAVGRVSPAQRTPQIGRFSPFAGCRTEGGKPTRAQDIQLARTIGARRTGPGPKIRHIIAAEINIIAAELKIEILAYMN